MANVLSYRPKAGEIPTQPGVYRFRDATGRVLYVGKAKNLRARLSNYFAPLHSLHERTRRMVTTAPAVEWTVVGTEVEALQLEFTWIKEFDPPFNVSSATTSRTRTWRSPSATRRRACWSPATPGSAGARYFGPYPKIWAVDETIDLMIKAFPIRTCTDSNYKRAMQSGKPCFAGQIGRCCGAVLGQGHDRGAPRDRRAIRRLHGQPGPPHGRRAHAGDEGGGRGAELRARPRAVATRSSALDAVLEKSAVVLRDTVDVDLFGIVHDELAAAVQQFIVRGGRIRGVRGWVVDKELDISMAELVDSIVLQATQRGHTAARDRRARAA